MPSTYTNIHLPINLPKLFGQLVAQVNVNVMPQINAWHTNQGIPSAMSLHYLHGTWIHIVERLAQMAADPFHKNNRFPLIGFIQDYKEVYRKDEINTKIEDLRIIIVNLTDRNYHSEDRYIINYEPILFPIYAELMAVMQASNLFTGYKTPHIPHTRIDHLHWGREAYYGHEKYELGEYIDGIELTDLELCLHTQNCLKFTNELAKPTIIS